MNIVLDILLIAVFYIPIVGLIEQIDTYMQKARPNVVDNTADTIWHRYEGILKGVLLFVFILILSNEVSFYIRSSIIIIPIMYQVSNMWWNYKNG